MRRKWLRSLAVIASSLLVLALGFVGFTFFYHVAWGGKTEKVTFKSGDLTIAGLLVKPDGIAPQPAVVILHGSGRAAGTHDHPGYRIHVNAFVRKGLSVLIYDKRGTGDSEGDFSRAGYNDFVQDALAAVQFLRSREDIDPLRIGLLGSSEGGWLTPEVATVAGDIAFVINRCGPPIPWDETVLFEIENDLRVGGVEPDVIQEALGIAARRWQYFVDAAGDSAMAVGAERDAINAALATIRRKLGSSASRLPASLPEYDPERYARLASNFSYDPTPFLRELDVPMLWVFGENDLNVPTARSVAVLEQLRSEFDRDITAKVYPDVGHSLMTWRGVANAGYVGGYLDLIGSWAQEYAER